MYMHRRRTVLKGLAAGAALGTLGAAAGQRPATAQQERYYLATVDQNPNRARVFDRSATRWNEEAIIWSFEGKTGWFDNKWGDLSDVKIRRTRQRGLVALLTASGGAVGIADITGRGEETDSDNLTWEAEPNGNPHALERIPYNGTIIAASSKGGSGDAGSLHIYAPNDPDDIDDFDNYTKIGDPDFAGAHGVLWDPRKSSNVSDGVLWVLGDARLVGYKVSGRGADTRFDRWRTVTIDHDGDHKMGHDLQPDYTHKGRLLLTDSAGVYAYDVNSGDTSISKSLWQQGRVKSIARHPSGEYIWVVGSPDTDEMGTHVQMGTTLGTADDERGWADARFYKARVFSDRYE